MEAEASRAGAYRHGAAWLGGVVLAGIAVVTAALCGTIAILVRNAEVKKVPPVGSGSLSLPQYAGFALLLAAGVGYAISHAASQEPGRLPRRIVSLVAHAERRLARIPPIPMLRGSLVTTTELSRLVAVVGPFASSAVAAAGTWLATGLGWRALLVGGAIAGATAAGAAILVEPHDTSIQSGGMTVALVVGAFAGFGPTAGAVVIAAVGAVWIILVGEVTDAVVRRGTAWVTLLLGGIALATSSVLAELDNTLASLTVSGTQPRSFADLAPLLAPTNAPTQIETVATTWLRFRETVTEPSLGEVSPPTDLSIRALYAVVDSAGFALATALLLIAACAFLLQRLGTTSEQSQLRSILTVARFTIPVLFATDVAENLSGAAAVLPHGSSQSVTGSDLDGVAGLTHTMAYLHWLMALSKWVIIAGVVVALLGAGLSVAVAQRRSTGGGTPLATAWRSVRAHVVIVVVLAFAVRNAQAMDAIRLLAGGDGVKRRTALVIVAIAVVAVAVRYLAELIGREVGHLVFVHPTAPPPAPVGPGRTRSAIEGFVGDARDASERETDRRVWFGAGIGALGAVMALFLDAPGLLVPVALWAVIELLSIPLRPASPADLAAGLGRRRAWRRLAVAAGGIVALVLLAWGAHAIAGAPGVRYLLAALGLAVAFLALIELVPFATVRGGWFGLRPLILTGCGVIPFCRVVVPGIATRCVVGGRWFARSVLRRLVLPIVWLLGRIGVRGMLTRALAPLRRLAAAIAATMTGRHRAAAGPAAAGDEPAEPATPSPAALAAADASLTALHAAAIGRVLGGLVPMIVGAGIVRSALGLVLYAPDRSGGAWLLLLGAGLVLAGPLVFVLPRLPGAPWGRGNGIAAVSVALTVVFVGYLVGWQLIDVGGVISFARWFGAIGVLCLGLAMFALIATTIAYLGDATESLPSLQLLRIRRSPFFAFAIVWMLVAGLLDGGGYHSIDTSRAEGAVGRGVTAESAFDQWAAECAASGSDREAVPMVFVAATGGGIRAAYWTARTLERLDQHVDAAWGADDPCTQPIFAASGASGGSVGLGAYAVQHLVDGTGQGDVAQRLSEDYLAPTVAWMLLADVVRPFFLWDGDGNTTYDRAGVLERALQGSWDPAPVDGTTPRRCGPTDTAPKVSFASGLRETWCLGAPLVILNGAEVNSACRFNASVLDNDTAVLRRGAIVPPSPASCRRTPTSDGASDGVTDVGSGPLGATIDLDDYLCDGDDVAMSTAALLSARFPLITPSGRVASCGKSLEESYIVDGGYLDNSGAASLVELWAEVSTYVDIHNATEGAVCIVPVFIQIDNGYEFDSGTAPGRPSELTLPLSTVFEARGSRESEAKQVAASIFTPPDFSGDKRASVEVVDPDDADTKKKQPVTRWHRIVPDAHPGVQAPLGWALSDAAQADLDDQLRLERFDVIDRWLDPNLTCD